MDLPQDSVESHAEQVLTAFQKPLFLQGLRRMQFAKRFPLLFLIFEPEPLQEPFSMSPGNEHILFGCEVGTAILELLQQVVGGW